MAGTNRMVDTVGSLGGRLGKYPEMSPTSPAENRFAQPCLSLCAVTDLHTCEENVPSPVVSTVPQDCLSHQGVHST